MNADNKAQFLSAVNRAAVSRSLDPLLLQCQIRALRIEVARFGLRHIEDVVDEDEKTGSGAPEHVHVLHLPGVKL